MFDLVFIRLIVFLSILLCVGLAYLIIPNVLVKKLVDSNSKYKIVPVMIPALSFAVTAIAYCIMKNTFWGFVSAWTGVFLLVCLIITMLRYISCKRKFDKKLYIKFCLDKSEWSPLIITGIMILLIIFADSAGSNLPKADNIEAVYCGYEALTVRDSSGYLMDEYAVLNPNKLPEMLEGDGVSADSVDINILIADLTETAENIRYDKEGIEKVLNTCHDLDRGYFLQRFCRKFSANATDKSKQLYMYVAFKTADGKITECRYELGEHNMPVISDEYYNFDEISRRRDAVTESVKSSEPDITEIGIRYRYQGMTREKILPPERYNKLFDCMKADGLKSDERESQPTMSRMTMYILNRFALPEAYKAFGFTDKKEYKYFVVSRNSSDTWNFIREFAEID